MGEFVGVGRHEMVAKLAGLVGSSAKPQLVVLSAPLGAGKTRVVQELYRRLAEGQAEPCYWPEAIVDPDVAGVDPGVNRKRVAPLQFVVPAGAEIEFLWWGISCERRQSGGALPALLQDGEQLFAHVVAVYERWSRGRRLKRLLRDPETRGRALALGNVAGAVAGPLGLLAGAMSIVVGTALAVPDVVELAKAGKDRWLKRRKDAEESAGRSVDLEEVDRSVLADQLAESLCAAVDGHPAVPTVVVIDDAHEADRATLRLVRRILEHPSAPVLVIATTWPEKLVDQRRAGDPESLAAVIGQAPAERVQEIRLDPLLGSDLGALVLELGPATEEPVVQALIDKAGDSPLAMRLLLTQDMVRTNVVDERIDLDPEDVAILPSEVTELYRALWEELDPRIRRTLAAATVLGEEFLAPLAASAALAVGVDAAVEALEEAEDPYGWVRTVDDLLLRFTESARRDVASKGQLRAADLEAARAAVLAEALHRVNSDDASGQVRERVLRTVLALTQEGFNSDLTTGRAAARELAQLAAERHRDREETHLLHLAVQWGQQLPGADTDHQLFIDLGALAHSARGIGDLPVAYTAATSSHHLAHRLAAQQPESVEALRNLSVSHDQLGDLASARGDWETADSHFSAAMDIRQRRIELQRDSVEALRELSLSHGRLGDLALGKGDLDAADSHYQAAIGLARRRMELEPDSLEASRDLWVLHERFGDLALGKGDLDTADSHYQAAIGLAQGLVELQPENVQALRDLSLCHETLGDLAQAKGALGIAEDHYLASMSIRQRLAELQPDGVDALRDLSVSHGGLGVLARTRGDLDTAETHFQAAVGLALRLVELQPDGVDAVRDLSVSHDWLGSLARARGDLDAAETHYLASMALAQRLVELQPENVQALRDLSVSHDSLGSLAQVREDLDTAETHYLAAMSLAQRLVKLQPENVQALRDLSVSHGWMGDLARIRGDLDTAETHFQAAMNLAQRSVELTPGSVAALELLFLAHDQLGNLARIQEDLDTAETHFQAEITVAQRLVEVQPDSVQALLDLSIAHHRVGDLAQTQGDLEIAEGYYRAGLVQLAGRLQHPAGDVVNLADHFLRRLLGLATAGGHVLDSASVDAMRSALQATRHVGVDLPENLATFLSGPPRDNR